MTDDNRLSIVKASGDLQPLVTGIGIGMDENLERQLIEKSRQPNILKFTPNDAAKRFGDPAMFERWKAGGREIHWLLGENNDLAGIIWYGARDFPLPMQLPETPSQTLAIRLYEGYTGHGLAVPAMKQSLALHVEGQRGRGEPVASLWLQTDTDNQAGLATYVKFGYQEVHRDDKRVTMILPASQVLEMAEALRDKP